MRNYTITVNGRETFTAKASRGSVAVHRVLDKFTDGQLDGATITMQRGNPVDYAYRLVADIPSEPTGCTKRDFISDPMPLKEIPDAMRIAKEVNPEYRFIGYKRIEL